jgi:signal peptidase I
VPGDRIRFENKQLILNGVRVREPYRRLDASQGSEYLNNFPRTPDILIAERASEMLANHVSNGELVVPPGQYFAMGDNRDNSADSRFPEMGLVPYENLVGRAEAILYSWYTCEKEPGAQCAEGRRFATRLQ